MSTWQERVKVELDELTERLNKLADYLETPAYGSLHAMHQALLCDQVYSMTMYQSVLRRRLALERRISQKYD